MAGISTKPFKGDVYVGTSIAHTRLGLTAAAAVDSTTTINGQVGTWAKTATGEYTYTFGTSPDFKVAGAGFRVAAGTSPGGQVFTQLIGAAAGTVACELKSMDLTTGTIVLRTYTKSTGAAVDTAAALLIDVMIVLFDSSVT